MDTHKPIIVILGPTASGKSALAIKIAKEYGAEIIAADSRTIYNGMDIGTAKPTARQQREIQHHCLDIVNPDEQFSAAQFKDCALQAMHEISQRGNIPCIVGGSGLYIDGLVYDFAFGDVDEVLRNELRQYSLEKLQEKALALGITPSDINYQNRRHLERAVERGGMVRKKKPLPPNVLMLGLLVSKEKLHERIEQRVESMIDAGLIQEVQNVIDTYSDQAPGLLAPGYKAFVDYIEHKIPLEDAKNIFITNDKKLAKRQMTWFKRNQDIAWVETEQQADTLVASFLAKFGTIHT